MEFTEEIPVGDNVYGSKLDYNDTGPIEKSRTKTNSCWFLSFMYFLIVWTGIVTYAFLEGDPAKYLHPVDSEGRVCGRDDGVHDSPHLVWYNRETCQQPRCLVCRLECPKVDFVYVNKANVTHNSKNKTTIFKDTIKRMICRSGIELKNVKSWEQLDYLVDNEFCAKSYNKTRKRDEGRWCGFQEEGDRFSDWRFTMPKLERSISETRKSVLFFIMLSGVIAVASVLILRFYALSFFCVSIFAMYGVVFNYVYEECRTNASSKTAGILLSLIISVVLLVCLVLAAAYVWQKISAACQLLAECSKAILNVKSTLLLAAALAVIILTALDLGFRVHLGLSTIETPVHQVYFANGTEECECSEELDYSSGSSCDPLDFQKGCRANDGNEPCVLSGCFMVDKKLVGSTWPWQIVNWVAVYWCFWFVVGFGDITLAGVFATWYWTFNKKILNHLVIVENFWRISTYHLGTLVLGALLIPICKVVRGTLKFVIWCLQKSKSPITALILLQLKGVFDWTDSILNYMDSRAYVMCAIHGTDFVKSARSAQDLVMRNTDRIAMNVQLSNWLLYGLSLLISFVVTRISESILSSKQSDAIDTSVPLEMIFIGSFIVSFMIFRVVETAVETIFCLSLEDGELNDGSYDRSNFLSEELARVLFKK